MPQTLKNFLLPIVQPAELWHETGRWADYGDEMFRLKDRHGREFCLGFQLMRRLLLL